jgi:high-affinity iron transporter
LLGLPKPDISAIQSHSLISTNLPGKTEDASLRSTLARRASGNGNQRREGRARPHWREIGGTVAMLGAAIIVFREVLEAALIVGIVLAASTGAPGRGFWISTGLAGGIVGAGVVALFAAEIAAAAAGIGQELLNAVILFLAVGMLGWHNIWMSRHGRELAATAREVGDAVISGTRPLYVLAVVVGLAVLREGSETVLFLYGIAAGGGLSPGSLLAGGALGLAGGITVGAALYLGLLRIPTRRLFTVTGWMVLLLSAGMASQAAGYLVQADLLPPLGNAVWDTSAVLTEDSVLGKALHTLIGYVSRPEGIQILFYLATLGAIWLLTRVVGSPVKPRPTPLSRGAAMPLIVTFLLAAFAAPALADDPSFSILLKNNQFVPSEVQIPAGAKVKLVVRNDNPTASEFESTQFHREKVVPPGQEITVFVGPLDPGSYEFFDDFHPETRGHLVVK